MVKFEENNFCPRRSPQYSFLKWGGVSASSQNDIDLTCVKVLTEEKLKSVFPRTKKRSVFEVETLGRSRATALHLSSQKLASSARHFLQTLAGA